LKEEEEL
jgi:hypothetical protein